MYSSVVPGTPKSISIGQRALENLFTGLLILADQSITQREFAPLESITDNYPKYVLSMDQFPGGDRNGIRRMYLPEFLLADHY